MVFGRILLFIFCLGAVVNVNAQRKQSAVADSLRNALAAEQSDSAKVILFTKLSKQYNKLSLDTSMYFAERAVELAQKLDDPNLKIYAVTGMGVELVMAGIYDRGMEYCLKALSIAETHEMIEKQIVIVTNIGSLYNYQEDYEQALAYYFEAVAIADSLEGDHYPFYLGHLYNNIGAANESLGKPDLAKEYYFKVLDLQEPDNYQAYYGNTLNNLGIIYTKEKAWNRAIHYLEKALAYRIEGNDRYSQARSYLALGHYYKARKEYQQAIDRLMNSLEISEETGSAQTKMEAAFSLAEVYEVQNGYQKAHQFYKEAKVMEDSLFSKRTAQEITRLQMQHQFNKKNAEFLHRQKQQESRMHLILSLLAFLLVLSLLIFYLQRQRNYHIGLKNELLNLHNEHLKLEHKSLKDDLEHKNKELTTNVLYLLKKNELILDISSRLSELKNKLKADDRKELHKVVLELQKNSESDVWEEFELRFQEVHNQYYNKLSELFPELTPNERRLSAFLRLNMSSKEISAITGQSVRSITVARSRLRKKLGITNEKTNLVSFLATI